MKSLIPRDGGNVCSITPSYFLFQMKIWGWIDMFLTAIMPFSTKISCNIADVIKIGQQQHQRHRQILLKKTRYKASSSCFSQYVLYSFISSYPSPSTPRTLTALSWLMVITTITLYGQCLTCCFT